MIREDIYHGQGRDSTATLNMKWIFLANLPNSSQLFYNSLGSKEILRCLFLCQTCQMYLILEDILGKVATQEWTKAKSTDTGYFFVLASKTIQALDSKPGSFNHTCISFHLKCYLPWVMIWVMDSIPWVRCACASGNV